MKGFIAFTKKEYMEQLRTYRLLILICVFFLFGMVSPLLAKLMPKMLEGMELQGIKFIIPEPTALDAYSQFFQNITEMGIIVVLLVFGGILSNELSKGTLINILAKGLPRHTIIFSKFTAAVTLWTISYAVGALTNYGYTEYLFDTTDLKNVLFSVFSLWLFVVFVIALILLSSAIVGGGFGGLIFTAAVLIAMLLLNMFPKVSKFNPIYLASHNLELLTGTLTPSDFTKPLIVTLILLVGCLYSSVVVFRRRKL
jgi:ABC-2 type transport system permease protein